MFNYVGAVAEDGICGVACMRGEDRAEGYPRTVAGGLAQVRRKSATIQNAFFPELVVSHDAMVDAPQSEVKRSWEGALRRLCKKGSNP